MSSYTNHMRKKYKSYKKINRSTCSLHPHSGSNDNIHINLQMRVLNVCLLSFRFLRFRYSFLILFTLLFLIILSSHLTRFYTLCYIVGLGLNCKFIDLLFKRSFIKFIKISLYLNFISKQTDTLN